MQSYPSEKISYNRTPQGRRIQIWLGGGFAAGFSNYWGGGGKIAPEFPIIGGQNFENPNISSAQKCNKSQFFGFSKKFRIPLVKFYKLGS